MTKGIRVKESPNPTIRSISNRTLSIQIPSRRRGDGDSSASNQPKLPGKAAISIMSIPSLRIGPVNAMVILSRQSTQFRLSRPNIQRF
jgi:hypothetical protein